MFLLFWMSPVFAQSIYVDGWKGKWDVLMQDNSTVSWELTTVFVSSSGATNVIHGIKNPGNVEFNILYMTMNPRHAYIEQPHITSTDELNQNVDDYTELEPNGESDNFTSFCGIEGPYPIISGVREGMGPFPACETQPDPCAARYLLGADDPRLDILRQFRDQKMAGSQSGDALISIYYENSEDMIASCEKSIFVKWSFKVLLEVMIPVIQMML